MLDVDNAARRGNNQEQPLHKTEQGAVCVQHFRCGKPNCRCTRGDLHGPYYALFWRENGRLRKRYLNSEDAAKVEAACRTRREQENQARETRQAAMVVWRTLQARLREVLK